jgi:hypothetical protein
MIERIYADGDIVSKLIGCCHQDHKQAEQLYQQIIVEHQRSVKLAEGTFRLTEAQHDEFVARFSAEVGTTIWQSKRLK